MAGRLREPNHQLATLIAEAGFSSKGLARRVVDLGHMRGYRNLKYNHSSVERWLRGEQPRPPTPELIGEVFSAALGRPVPLATFGMAQERAPDSAALHLQPTPADAARIVGSLTEGDLKQRRVLVMSGFDLTAYSSAALRWLLAPRTAMTASNGTRRIGIADVQEIREATGAFRVLDNRLGGGRIRPTVVEYLHSDIAPLLRQSRCTEDVRRHLFSAAAELTQLAGWQAYDLEMQGLAQRYLVQALTMARFAGDEGLGGEVLAAMSHQAAYVAQPEHAIDMARAAQLAGRRAGLSVLQTESIVMEAHGHALRKDAGSCSRALRRAETTFSQTTGRDLPAWLSYFDQAYFAAKIAHCFHALGQGKQTEIYALRSLDMNPRYIRGKAFNTALLAIGYALQGELDQACAHGREAIDLTGGLDSARATTYIRRLLSELAAHEQEEQVRGLKSYAETTLPALQQRAARR
jgi:tetratricopeptide (TPR) repeat protein